MSRYIPIKEYLCSLCIGKILTFKCNCPVSFNEKGIIKSFKVVGSDIILYVERLSDKKVFSVTLNNPGLSVLE